MVASNEVEVVVIVVRWWGATKAVAVPTKAAEASREQIFMVIEILRGNWESGKWGSRRKSLDLADVTMHSTRQISSQRR